MAEQGHTGDEQFARRTDGESSKGGQTAVTKHSPTRGESGVGKAIDVKVKVESEQMDERTRFPHWDPREFLFDGYQDVKRGILSRNDKFVDSFKGEFRYIGHVTPKVLQAHVEERLKGLDPGNPVRAFASWNYVPVLDDSVQFPRETSRLYRKVVKAAKMRREQRRKIRQAARRLKAAVSYIKWYNSRDDYLRKWWYRVKDQKSPSREEIRKVRKYAEWLYSHKEDKEAAKKVRKKSQFIVDLSKLTDECEPSAPKGKKRSGKRRILPQPCASIVEIGSDRETVGQRQESSESKSDSSNSSEDDDDPTWAPASGNKRSSSPEASASESSSRRKRRRKRPQA